jgi:hypothetical protein
MLPTFNTTNTTNTTQHNFVGKIFDRLCPGNSADTILHASESHMSPFELVLTACVVVAILSFLPALAKLERYVFDVDGDGKVDMDDVWFCLKRCCCRSTAPTPKTPTSKITPIIGKTEDSEDEGIDEDMEGDKEGANDEDKDEVCPPIFTKKRRLVPIPGGVSHVISRDNQVTRHALAAY